MATFWDVVRRRSRGLIELGLHGRDVGPQLYRTYVLTNITLVLLFFISLSAGFGMHLRVGDFGIGLVSLGFGFCYAALLAAQWRGRHNLARMALVLLAASHYMMICTAMGPEAGVGIYGFVFSGSPILLFSRYERGFLIVAFVVLGMALLGGQALMYAVGPLIQADATTLTGSRIFAFVAIAAYSAAIVFYYNRAVNQAEDDLVAETHRSEDLLANILPLPISARLKRQENPIADRLSDVSVMFADLVGFTKFANDHSASEVVKLLNLVFCGFDALADQYGLEKIKTIGDAYMVAGGLPPRSEDSAAAIAWMALDMQAHMQEVRRQMGYDIPLRIGIHRGPVVAGVIGNRKFTYDLWGDTVNRASRLERKADAGTILVSDAVRADLDERFVFEPLRRVEVKGLGFVAAYCLTGAVEAPCAQPKMPSAEVLVVPDAGGVSLAGRA